MDNEKTYILYSREDIEFLLEKTDFDEYDIREWFRAFIKVTIKFTLRQFSQNFFASSVQVLSCVPGLPQRAPDQGEGHQDLQSHGDEPHRADH